jgi:putative transposase
MEKDNTKSRIVPYNRVPRNLWRKFKKYLPNPPAQHGPGRPRVNDHNVLNGIWYVLWSGCQWKSIPREWFGVSSSVLHERFQTWQKEGLFDQLFRVMVKFYARERHIGWKWQSGDSKMVPAPLGGAETGKNPTDRGKLGAKIHIWVDEHGAPLSLVITGANQQDKWSVDNLIVHIAVKRPFTEQHGCLDRGYDYADDHQALKEHGYVDHIKHRRLKNEPKVDDCPIPGETRYPPRRWVVERTLGWLAKRRSIKIRWCKKPENWMAFLKLACADILLNLIFG